MLKTLLTVLFFSCTSVITLSQVTENWTVRQNEGYGDEASVVRVDKQGNVYVFGSSDGTFKYDYLTVKYDSSGNLIWKRRYNGFFIEDDFGTCMELDKEGNIYVAGTSYRNSGTSNGGDLCIIKYRPNGDSSWVRRHSGVNGYGRPTQMAIDNNKNVIVTGFVFQNDFDFFTVKYDSNGVLLWSRQYNGPGNERDYPASLAIDNNNNIYVAGQTYGIGTDADFCTIKYNSNGVQQWVTTFNGMANYRDGILDMTIDKGGDIVVTGFVSDSIYQNKFCTIKYNSLGNQIWFRTFSRYNSNVATCIQSDSLNNIYVSGSSGFDIATIKYAPNGDSVWVRIFNKNINSAANPVSMVLDQNANIYVTGFVTEVDDDYLTFRYNSNGDIQWFRIIDGGFGKSDISQSICLDANNNVYVTGTSNNNHNNNNFTADYYTIKYSQTNPSIKVNLKLLFEGIYFNLLNKLLRRDTVQVFLRDVTTPFAVRDSAKAVIDSNNFTGLLTFQNAPSGNYYIVTKHFSSIETWSKSGGESLSSGYSTYSYDFTNAVNKAYGNNLKLKGSRYCLYSGDISQDGYVTLFDVISIHNDASNFTAGSYLATDLNGDNLVDLDDVTLCFNNSVSFKATIRP